MICRNSKTFLALAIVIAAAFAAETQAQSTSKTGFPVLVYHDIQPDEEGQTQIGVVRLSLFKEQMRYLHEQGYQTMTLSEMDGYLSGKKINANKLVMIHFDDGLKSVSKVLPILTEYGFKAGFAIVPSSVGRFHTINWEDINKISTNPLYNILSHTVTHSCLAGQYDGNPGMISEKIEKEITDPRQIFSEKIGQVVNALVWPCGAFNAASTRYALKNGYQWLFTMRNQLNYPKPDHHDISRAFISGNCGMKEFAMTLSDGKARDCPRARSHS